MTFFLPEIIAAATLERSQMWLYFITFLLMALIALNIGWRRWGQYRQIWRSIVADTTDLERQLDRLKKASAPKKKKKKGKSRSKK